MNSMSKWFQREQQSQPAEMPKPAIVERNAKVSTAEVPRLTISFDRIRDAIIFIENNVLLGAGKITKIEHLTDHLFTLFKLGSDEPETPVLAYEEILEEIKLVNDNELFGAGKFTKKDILTDRLLAKFTLRLKVQKDAKAASNQAQSASTSTTPAITPAAPEARTSDRMQKVRAAVQSQLPSSDGTPAFS